MKPVKFSISILLTAAGLFLLVACDSNRATSVNNNEETLTDGSIDNTLTNQEKQEGWVLLFDGQSLDSWKVFNKQSEPDGWKIEDGTLAFTGKDNKKTNEKSNLITKDQYEDFELALDWKISEGGNSGIMFHVVENAKYPEPYHTGPEMQILDDERHPDAKQNNNKRIAGSNYDLYTPSAKANPAGEWNSIRLRVENGKVEHYMNGKKVVEYQLGSDQWKEDVKNSKFVTFPDYGTAGKGHIAFQDHDDKVWFRNIKIRKL
jgi:hypothetical protein